MQSDDPEYTESSAGEYTAQLRHRGRRPRPPAVRLHLDRCAGGRQVACATSASSSQFLTKPAGATWQNLYCDAKNMAATGADTAYPLSLVLADPVAERRVGARLPEVRHQRPGHLPVRDLEAGLREERSGEPEHVLALQRPHRWPAERGRRRSPTTTSRSAGWSTRSRTASTGRTRRSSSSRTTPRPASTTSTATVPRSQIISPWAQHGAVDNHYYSQITMIRTIEQILGIHPMNQKDSAATPMSAAFTQTPGLHAVHRAAQPDLADRWACRPCRPAARTPRRRRTRRRARAVGHRAGERAGRSRRSGRTWKAHQRLTGPNAVPDFANPAQMNHFTWYQTHDWTKPYPGEHEIYPPDQVPGAYLPSPESGD